MRLLAPALAIASFAAHAAGLPFLNDDFGKARMQAMDRKLPIFVECWAPW